MRTTARRLSASLAGGRSQLARLDAAVRRLVRELQELALQQSNRLAAVQILRATAALAVVTGHALYETRGFDPAGASRPLFDVQWWTAGVDLFFVISGFIMMWTFGHRFGEAGAGRAFLTRRIARIVPCYWIFTALMVLAIFLFAHRLDSASFTPGHALLSFLFIPHLAPQGGIHPILALGWTLIYEMYFYLSFAAVLIFPRRIGIGVLVASFAAAHLVARGTGILPTALQIFWGDAVMFEFLLGIGFYFALEDGRLGVDRLIALLAFCLLTGLAAWLAGIWGSSRFFHFGLPALAVFGLGYALLADTRSWIGLGLGLAGEASYSLYLSHPFVIEVLKTPFAWLFPAAAGTALAFLITCLVAATSFSILFFLLVERRMTFWLLHRSARQQGA